MAPTARTDTPITVATNPTYTTRRDSPSPVEGQKMTEAINDTAAQLVGTTLGGVVQADDPQVERMAALAAKLSALIAYDHRMYKRASLPL